MKRRGEKKGRKKIRNDSAVSASPSLLQLLNSILTQFSSRTPREQLVDVIRPFGDALKVTEE